MHSDVLVRCVVDSEHQPFMMNLARLYSDGIKCPQCKDNFTSMQEREMAKWLDDVQVEYLLHDRGILAGQEIDIIIPKARIGIEMNGLFWHNQHAKVPEYHANKAFGATCSGYQLVSIFEDEWKNSRDRVTGYLRYALFGTEHAGELGPVSIQHAKYHSGKCLWKNEPDSVIGIWNQEELIGVVRLSNIGQVDVVPVPPFYPSIYTHIEAIKAWASALGHTDLFTIMDKRWPDQKTQLLQKIKDLPPRRHYVLQNRRVSEENNNFIYDCGHGVYRL